MLNLPESDKNKKMTKSYPNNTSFTPPIWQWNKHVQTIYPSLFRNINLGENVKKEANIICTPDDDFLEYSQIYLPHKRSKGAVIICHGLEGDQNRAYIQGMVRTVLECDLEAFTWNYRGCGNELNKQAIFYHSGATYDLASVIEEVKSKGFEYIYLIGFSLGGNLVLKYLGENGSKIPSEIIGGSAISVPLHLESSCEVISKGFNKIYAYRFLRSLKRKVKAKAELHPGLFDLSPLEKINTLAQFDDIYTAPLHGFKNAHHYYESCSSLYFLNDIKVPTNILSALNDPFLSEKCLPMKIENPKVATHYSQQGGHVGFYNPTKDNKTWAEKKLADILKNL